MQMTPDTSRCTTTRQPQPITFSSIAEHGMFFPGMSVCLTPNGDVVFHGAGDLLFQSLL